MSPWSLAVHLLLVTCPPTSFAAARARLSERTCGAPCQPPRFCSAPSSPSGTVSVLALADGVLPLLRMASSQV